MSSVPAIQRRENLNAGGAGKRGQPLREFMLRQTREADLGLFADWRIPARCRDLKLCRCAFCSGLRDQRVENRISDRLHDFHPFLIIDLVIASVLMALGMMMFPLPPLLCPLN